MINDNEYLSIEETAKLLHVHYNTVYRWIQSGQLAAYRYGGGPWRILKSSTDTLIKKNQSLNS